MRKKGINLKARNKHRGRPRKSQVSREQYAQNWDRIFKKDK